MLKRLIAVALLMCVAFATVYTSPAHAADVVTINQWYHQYGEAGTQDAVQKYADDYNKANPNVKVVVTWVLGDYMGAKLPAALQTADAPDVYEVGPVVTADFVKAGLVADLSDLYTPDITKDFGAAMGFVMINGKPYGIKMINDSVAIYYRKSVLDAAGVKPPTTMDELIAAATKLNTKSQSGLFIGNDSGKSAYFAKLMMYSADPTHTLIKDGKVAFDDAKTVAAWTKAKALADSGALLVGNTTDWWDPSAFTDGTAAMQMTGLWAMPGIRKAIGDDFGVIPWPALDASSKPAVTLGGWSEVVNAKSAHLAEAKAFAKYLWIDNTAVQQDWSLSYGFHIPPRASAAASADKLKTGQAADFVNIVSQDAHLEGDPFWTAAMDQALTDAMSNIIANGNDPKAELDAATTKINSLLAGALVATAAATAAH